MKATPDLEADTRFMRRALTLAARGKRTHPNPRVGAIIVRDGVVVGEGWHKGVGTPHAETMAFAQAGERARGATIYTTLEPCFPTTRRDGTSRVPCVARCRDAGVARVVSAMEDPDSRVNGRSFVQLAAAGVAVTVGVEEQKARALNPAFIHHRVTGFPYITHKAAMTLDGKIAASGGDAKWITSEKSREYVHRLRNRVDAVLVGIGTILADDPQLTVRLPGNRNVTDPVRVLLDSRLRLPVAAKVARPGTLLLTTDGADSIQRNALEACGVEIIELPADESNRVDVTAAARTLAERGLLDILLESGGTLAAAFYQARRINRALFFIAPKIIGGANAPTPVDGEGLAPRMAEALQLGILRVRRFGADIALEAEVGE